MKRVGKICLCLAGGLVLNAGPRASGAVLPDNPYAPIVSRNVFDIHPPPPVDPNKPGADSLPKITPNGIMSVLGHTQALFKATAPAVKPGQAAKEQSYMLSEGEAQDDIEVTKIDEAAGMVTFDNHGTIQELPLASTPASGASAPAQGGPGAGPKVTMPFNAPGGGNPNNGANRFGNGNRFGRSATYPAPQPGPQTEPESGPQFAPQFAPQSGPQSQSPLSADDQAVMLTKDHAVAVARGDPSAIIYPPTPYDADAGVPSNFGPPPPLPNGSTAH